MWRACNGKSRKPGCRTHAVTEGNGIIQCMHRCRDHPSACVWVRAWRASRLEARLCAGRPGRHHSPDPGLAAPGRQSINHLLLLFLQADSRQHPSQCSPQHPRRRLRSAHPQPACLALQSRSVRGLLVCHPVFTRAGFGVPSASPFGAGAFAKPGLPGFGGASLPGFEIHAHKAAELTHRQAMARRWGSNSSSFRRPVGRPADDA